MGEIKGIFFKATETQKKKSSRIHQMLRNKRKNGVTLSDYTVTLYSENHAIVAWFKRG